MISVKVDIVQLKGKNILIDLYVFRENSFEGNLIIGRVLKRSVFGVVADGYRDEGRLDGPVTQDGRTQQIK